MKKLLLVLLGVLFLSGCKYNSIASSIYVASMHFAHDGEQYKANFYVINSLSIGLNDTSESDTGSLATIESESMADVFAKLDLSTALDVNLMHVGTIILDTSILKKEYIKELLMTIRNNPKISYNSYIFVSEDKAEEIYKIKNPGGESDLYSIINSPLDRRYLYLMCEPISFLAFASDFLNEKCIQIPVFSLEDSWDTDGVNYYVDSVCLYDGEKNQLLSRDDYPGFQFLFNHLGLLAGDENLSYYMKQFKARVKYKEKLIVSVFFYYDTYYSKVTDERSYIIEYIEEEFAKLKELDMDYMNINYINKLKKKNYTIDDLVISIKFKK